MARHIGHLIAHVHHYQHRYVHPRLEDLGLSRGQPPILMNIGESVTQHELAQRVNIRPPTLTRILAGLEDRGFVERRQDEEDKRANRVFLTDAGKRAVRGIRTVMEAENRDVFSVLTEPETEELRSLLQRIADRYEEVVESKNI